MKRVVKKIRGKYKYKWELEFADWLSLTVILMALNYIMIRLIIGAL